MWRPPVGLFVAGAVIMFAAAGPVLLVVPVTVELYGTRSRIRWEIRDDIYEALLRLGCGFICWRRLRHSSSERFFNRRAVLRQ